MAKSRAQRAATTSKASHVHFDEREDVIASLELLCLLVSKVDKNPSCWKWCIIAAHGALQGALVCKPLAFVGQAVTNRIANAPYVLDLGLERPAVLAGRPRRIEEDRHD
jgi:hypothetical protein